jgi:hypothetical protein
MFGESGMNTTLRNTESIGFGKQGKGVLGNGTNIGPLPQPPLTDGPTVRLYFVG